MKADHLLIEHHNVLRALCKTIFATPVETAERQDRVDELMVELDIHMRTDLAHQFGMVGSAAASTSCRQSLHWWIEASSVAAAPRIVLLVTVSV